MGMEYISDVSELCAGSILIVELNRESEIWFT